LTGASRRDFLSAVFGAVGAGALLDACGRRARSSPTPASGLQVDVRRLSADGQAMVTPEHGPDGASILIVREAPDRFHALSMQCTHEGCEVNPPERGVITCPCHGSRFDLEGKVLRGPADFPLPRYVARYDGKAKRLLVQFGT